MCSLSQNILLYRTHPSSWDDKMLTWDEVRWMTQTLWCSIRLLLTLWLFIRRIVCSGRQLPTDNWDHRKWNCRKGRTTVWYEQSPTSLFCMRLVPPATFVEKTIFLIPLNEVGTLVKLTYIHRFISELSNAFHWPVSDLYARTTQPWLPLLYNKFWNQEVWVFQFWKLVWYKQVCHNQNAKFHANYSICQIAQRIPLNSDWHFAEFTG